jgi:predicted metal-dependent phosphoesterase TrpH
MGFANMHLHSTHSDGMLTPRQLVELAKKEGLGALVLTDHDVASGYDEIKLYADQMGIDTMTGVEFCSVDDDNVCSHILAFDFDLGNEVYKKFVDGHCRRRNEHTRAFFEYARRKGNIKNITWDEIVEYNKGVKWFSNNHIFRAMEAKRLIKQEQYFPWWEENFGPKAYFHKEMLLVFPKPEETISVIKAAKGVSVYAHPSITGPKENRLSYLDKLVEMGVEGVELNHPEVPKEDELYLRKKAEKLNLFITGGTDHTGVFAGFDGKGRYGDNPQDRLVYNYAAKDEYFAIKNRK